jgi:2-hydroxy-3-keto-5-methylthiopentenyl-1-phosphate phosphatase
VIYVGDGLSDRCGARAADIVFARGALLDWCRSEGVEARPFHGFGGLIGALAA